MAILVVRAGRHKHTPIFPPPESPVCTINTSESPVYTTNGHDFIPTKIQLESAQAGQPNPYFQARTSCTSPQGHITTTGYKKAAASVDPTTLPSISDTSFHVRATPPSHMFPSFVHSKFPPGQNEHTMYRKPSQNGQLTLHLHGTRPVKKPPTPHLNNQPYGQACLVPMKEYYNRLQ